MHRRDHGHRQFAPQHGNLLECVGVAVRPVGQAAHPAARACAAACHAGHVKACAETASFARQHHRAYAFHGCKLFAGRDDPLKHRRVKCVHLVRTRQPNVGDMIVDGNGYAVVHSLSNRG